MNLPNKTHIFFHSTRSGGVTLKDILAKQYDNIFDIFQFKNYDERRKELSGISGRFKRKIELVQGHQYFGIHEEFEQDCIYFTLLRHPVDRVISAYQSFRKTKDSPHHAWANHHSLRSALSGDDCNGRRFVNGFWEFNNYYTRVLANIRPEEVRYGEIEDKHYQHAKNNLREHFISAPAEQFDEMLIYLYNKLGWRKYPLYSRANSVKKKNRIEVDEETKKIIRRLNHYDLELYYYAKSEFEERVKEIPFFEKSVQGFKRKNRAMAPLLAGSRIKRKLERMI